MGELMLIAQAAKRDGISLFDRQLRYDLRENDALRGSLIFNPKERSGAVTIDGQDFIVARLSAQPEEAAYQALFRLIIGGEKPAANPFTLKDATGQTLALADRNGQSFAVTNGKDGYLLRRPGMFARLYELYPEGNQQSLGKVGQAKFFTRQLQMDLPASLPAAFQVFLLTLIIDLSLQNLDSASS